MNIEAGGGIGRGESDEDDGPVIPDLDDVQDEDLALQVGAARHVPREAGFCFTFVNPKM